MVIMETDNLMLFQFHHLKLKKHHSSSFGLIVKDILFLANSCAYFDVSHVGREGNGVVHRLVQKNYHKKLA